MKVKDTPDFESLFLVNNQSPGDILMLTAAVRDLKHAYPQLRVNVQTSCMELWKYNPNIDRTISSVTCDKFLKCEYPLINTSSRGAHHFIHGFRKFLEEKLQLVIPQGPMTCDVYLSKQEAEDDGWIKEAVGADRGYWLVNAGAKFDFTAKKWETARFQEVVNRTKDRIKWVQIGAGDHDHPRLSGVVDLVGRTNHRQFCQLMYRAGGVLTGVSYPMHLATMPMIGECGRKRPCVVVAGGREPSVWEAYTNHAFLHTCGMLKCCDNGGCWKSRIVPLNDNDKKDRSLCLFPVKCASKQVIPKCLDMITADDVVRAIDKYATWEWSRKMLERPPAPPPVREEKVELAAEFVGQSFAPPMGIGDEERRMREEVARKALAAGTDGAIPG